MDTIGKIKKSWWVLLSFILFLNGFGFIYIGARHNNKNWLLEGLIYELPWLFYFIFFVRYGTPVGLSNPTAKLLLFTIILMLVCIIRSIWVAVKLFDIYQDDEVTVRHMNAPAAQKENSSMPGCCLCILVVFFIFALIAIL